jgi:hypothetical protein
MCAICVIGSPFGKNLSRAVAPLLFPFEHQLTMVRIGCSETASETTGDFGAGERPFAGLPQCLYDLVIRLALNRPRGYSK